MPKVPGWVILTLLTAALMMLISAFPLTAQEPEILGRTGCDSVGQTAIQIKKDLPDSLMMLVLFHELVHYRQIRVYPGGCKAMMRRALSDPRFEIKLEIEAYCATLKAFPKFPEFGDLNKVANLIENKYGNKADFTPFEARMMFVHYCTKNVPP